jgi:type VI secretion system secreted protein Hcp
MAMQGFLTIEDVKGECKNEKYKDWIDIKNFTWSSGQKTSFMTGGGMAGGGRPEIAAFHFEKDNDKSSGALLKHCLSGTHFKSAKVILLKAGGTPTDPYIEFLNLDFKKVFMTKFEISASNDFDVPGEVLEFVFEEVLYQYWQQTETGARDATPDKAGWNVKSNKPTA